MQIISGTTEFKSEDRTAVAIGKFDGIHLGHRELLKQILRAKEDGLKTTIFTFDPSPAVFFSGKEQAELTTKNEKRRIFERLGVDLLVEFPMNAQTAAIPAERFVKEILCERLQTRFLAAGTDLSFGDQGKGNWHLLKALSGKYGYQIQVLDKMLYEGREISSTFVREELKKGNMELVTRLLGEPYSITGHVAHGKQLGRTIGMPTMNLLDAGIIMRRLQATGWTLEEAQSMYGLLSGFCSPLIAFPQIFTQAVAVSLVPAIAAAFKIKDTPNVQENVKLGYRMTMIMAFPCAFGILALGEPIMLFMYSAQEASAIAAVPILQIMAISIVFLASTQTSVGVLQAIGKQNLPVIHLAIGCVGKVIATFVLAGVTAINVKGAAIGTLIAYVVAMILNDRAVKKYTGVKFNYELTYLRPCIAAGVMGVCAFAAHKLFVGFLGNSVATLAAIMVGAVVYAILIFSVKAITVDEVETTLPGGTKIAKVVRKFVK
jgi:riboflavin kinase/FMN adenylyltransferase